MILLVRQLFALSLCRLSPIALPYSRSALLFVAFLNVCNHLFVFGALDIDFGQKMFLSGAVLGSEMAVLGLILWLRRQENRFIKCAIAFLGTHIIISLILRVLLVISPDVQLNQMLGFLFAVWALVVKSHIFQKGLEVSRLSGILFAIGFEFVSAIPVIPVITGVVQ